jgi:hypothetical protein
VITHTTIGNICTIRVVVTADYAGAIDAVTLPAFEGRLLNLITDPGSPAPSGGWDVTLVDAYGHDCLEGVGMNRSATLTEKVPIVYSGTGTHVAIDECDVLALTFAQNLVTGAEIIVVLVYGLGS